MDNVHVENYCTKLQRVCASESRPHVRRVFGREVCIFSAQSNSLHISILIDPKNLGTHLNRGKVVMCCRSPTRKSGKSHYLFNVLNTFPSSRTRISRFLPLGGWQGRPVIVCVHSRKRRLTWEDWWQIS